jgi:hypothetical protein
MNQMITGSDKMMDTKIERDIKEMLGRDFKRVDKFDIEKGGIYVETTEDPRGWMFGDKTRKIYEVPHLSLKLLTDLLLIVTSNNDGSKIKVTSYNHQEVSMMLLSKNDDVGSSIEYACVDESGPRELAAKIGCHICVESIMRRNWIRAQIFPGSNIVKIINNDKAEIMKLVESSQIYMRERLQKLVNKYYLLEDDIDIALTGLVNFGGECDCKSPDVYKKIHEGDFDEIIEFCLYCGGTVD